MNKNSLKSAGLVVVAVLFIAAIIWWGAGSPQIAPTPPPSPQQAQSSTPPQTNAPSPSPTRPPQKLSPAPPPAGSNVQPATVHIVAPAPGAQWIQNTKNSITWNKETGIVGGIYLVNAADGSVVGWILQETNPHDTKFEWNTRDVFLSRSNPASKAVTAGQYMIKVAFDGGNPKFEISSGVFSVIYPSQAQTDSYTLTIKNYAITPSALTVKKGSKLVFVNGDFVPQQILLSSYSPITIQPGTSYTFDTSILEPAPYAFYSNQYPTLRTTVTVQ